MKNENWKVRNGKWWVAVFGLLIMAAVFRIAVAHWLPNDAPDDGRIYAQMARNVLEQHVYSHESAAPFVPSLIRLPGYPLFLASIYSIFGHTSNGAVRVLQALIDTATCALIALLAFYWQPDESRKHASALAALVLAAVCPFTTIYAATILTEVPTNFLIMAMFLAATIAFRKTTTEDIDGDGIKRFTRAILWWSAAGLIGGVSVLFRPDNGLFLAAIGITLVIAGGIWSAVASAARRRFGFDSPLRLGEGVGGEGLARKPSPQPLSQRERGLKNSKLLRTLVAGALFSLAFAFVLTPWTIRNWRVFHVFQPLSPAHAEMPGEFVPRGYMLWLRTWVDDERYVAPFLWGLDSEPIDIDDLPPSAFDSTSEKDRVAALLNKYNHADEESTDDQQDEDKPDDSEEPEPADQPQEQSDQTAAIEMTPEIDAGFAQLARERISHHRFRYYVWLPIKRAETMWFDTHSQYWPFEGTLLPLEDLDYEHHQQYWLPLFAGLTALYTLLGLAGSWVLWRARTFAARRWLLLAVLAILLRLILFSSLENPEPRYLVEFFPFLSILGGIAISRIVAFLPQRSAMRSVPGAVATG
jgi:hypothetical protein